MSKKECVPRSRRVEPIRSPEVIVRLAPPCPPTWQELGGGEIVFFPRSHQMLDSETRELAVLKLKRVPDSGDFEVDAQAHHTWHAWQGRTFRVVYNLLKDSPNQTYSQFDDQLLFIQAQGSKRLYAFRLPPLLAKY